MVNRVQGGNGYFSQAVADYAKNNRPKTRKDQEEPKMIGEFSEKEWDKLLNKVDSAIEEYRKDLERRKEDALDQKREQTQDYILGCSAKAAEELEQLLLRKSSAKDLHTRESGSDETMEETQKPDLLESAEDAVPDELINKLLGKDRQAPYSVMADENGTVIYNDVAFQCDYDNNRICLGDVSNPDNCITVSLEKGGCLVFNRDNIGDLAKAIGMFSPEDVNRIMRAIAQDAKLKQTQMQIEDESSGVEVLDRPEEASGAENVSHPKKEED